MPKKKTSAICRLLAYIFFFSTETRRGTGYINELVYVVPIYYLSAS